MNRFNQDEVQIDFADAHKPRDFFGCYTFVKKKRKWQYKK